MVDEIVVVVLEGLKGNPKSSIDLEVEAVEAGHSIKGVATLA